MAPEPPSPPLGAPPSSTPVAPPLPSSNPIPLSATQEAAVRDVFYARVRQRCSDEIKGISPPPPLPQPTNPLSRTAFAACALNRTFTVSFACRDQHRAMNSCMKLHATPAEHDAAREEWFAGRMERHRQRERKARRAMEQERFLREWWGLPEKDREAVMKEREMLGRKERFGGFASGRAGGRGDGGEGGKGGV